MKYQLPFFDYVLLKLRYHSWKCAYVQPIHKKNKCQMISNYKPISLLTICRKILEKSFFNQVYLFLDTNKLSKDQSGFRPGDSTIYQLISIMSTIYESFEKYDETRAIFLDISKAFDKVWHDGVMVYLEAFKFGILNYLQKIGINVLS